VRRLGAPRFGYENPRYRPRRPGPVRRHPSSPSSAPGRQARPPAPPARMRWPGVRPDQVPDVPPAPPDRRPDQRPKPSPRNIDNNLSPGSKPSPRTRKVHSPGFTGRDAPVDLVGQVALAQEIGEGSGGTQNDRQAIRGRATPGQTRSTPGPWPRHAPRPRAIRYAGASVMAALTAWIRRTPRRRSPTISGQFGRQFVDLTSQLQPDLGHLRITFKRPGLGSYARAPVARRQRESAWDKTGSPAGSPPSASISAGVSAVTTMTPPLIAAGRVLSRRIILKPSISGIARSVIIRSGEWRPININPSKPSSAVSSWIGSRQALNCRR
jgi:hypothetical protein